MQLKSLQKLGLLVAALCLVAAPLYAGQQNASQQQTGDSVADAARKAREEKKSAAKPKKVYTDDDLARGSSTATSSSTDNGTANTQPATEPSQAEGTQAAANKPSNADAGDKNSEAAWRKRFKEQNEKIAKAEKDLDLLQREQDKAQVQYYPDPQKALTEQFNRQDINDKAAKIEAKKQEIAKLKQGLDAMEDELRKNGGDPGWAR